MDSEERMMSGKRYKKCFYFILSLSIPDDFESYQVSMSVNVSSSSLFSSKISWSVYFSIKLFKADTISAI
jgi:hypothetical protein